MRRRDLFKTMGAALVVLTVPVAVKAAAPKPLTTDEWAELIRHEQGHMSMGDVSIEEIERAAYLFQELPNPELKLYMWDLLTQDCISKNNARRWIEYDGMRPELMAMVKVADDRAWNWNKGGLPFCPDEHMCLQVSREKTG